MIISPRGKRVTARPKDFGYPIYVEQFGLFLTIKRRRGKPYGILEAGAPLACLPLLDGPERVTDIPPGAD